MSIISILPPNLNLTLLVQHWQFQYAHNIFFWSVLLYHNYFLKFYTFCSKNGLELVPQPAYSQGKTRIISDAQTDSNWDLPGQHQGGLGGDIASKNLEPDDLARYSPIASRWAWSNGDCYCELNVQITTICICWWVLFSLNSFCCLVCIKLLKN